jgi:hypothetical protein
VCDAACPAGLSPFALVAAVHNQLPAATRAAALPARGTPHPDRAARRMAIDLLLLRAGLLPPMETATS